MRAVDRGSWWRHHGRCLLVEDVMPPKIVAVLAGLLLFAGCGEEQRVRPITAAAEGAVAWSPTARLSTGVELEAPAVGIAASGAALAVFAESDSYTDTTRALSLAAAPAGQPFGTTRVLSDDATAPALAVSADGQAVLSYLRNPNGPDRQAVLVRGNVDGSFGEPVAFGRADAPDMLALAADGTVVAVTESFRGRHLRVDVRSIPANGRPGASRELGPVDLSSAGALAVGTDGTVAVVFLEDRSRGPDRVRVAVRVPGGPLHVSTAMEGRLAAPQVAVGPGGRIAVVATHVEDRGEAAAYGGVVVAERRPGARHFGATITAPVTPRRHPYAFNPTVAYGAHGRRVVAWVADADPGDTEGEAEDSRGASFIWTRGRPQRLDRTTRVVTLVGTEKGVLALTDSGPWQAFAVEQTTARHVAAPAGEASAYATSAVSDRVLLASPARLIFAFVGTRPERVAAATAILAP